MFEKCRLTTAGFTGDDEFLASLENSSIIIALGGLFKQTLPGVGFTSVKVSDISFNLVEVPSPKEVCTLPVYFKPKPANRSFTSVGN
jgi:hypothetical protein